MKHALLAAAASLLMTIPAEVAAQDTAVVTAPDGDTFVLTPEQTIVYDAWPVDRRTLYDAWPNDYKVYFWTLTPPQQEGWWVLDDDQRSRVFAMTPEQRAAAWASIASQMSGTPPAQANAGAASTTGAMAGTPAAGTSTMASGNMQFSSNPVVQNIPMDQATGDVPVCEKGQTDNCINAWEAGRRGPSVTRPLEQWPGKPASEMPGQ